MSDNLLLKSSLSSIFDGLAEKNIVKLATTKLPKIKKGKDDKLIAHKGSKIKIISDNSIVKKGVVLIILDSFHELGYNHYITKYGNIRENEFEIINS